MVKVNRNELESNLGFAGMLVKKSSIPGGDCFHFDGKGKVWAFNSFGSFVVVGGVGEGIKGAVLAEPFLSLLTKLNEDEVDFRVEGNELRVSCSNKEAGILFRDYAEASESINEACNVFSSSSFFDDSGWTALNENFLTFLDEAVGCVSKNIGSFVLECVHITPEFIEACDGFQMVRFRLNTGFKDAFKDTLLSGEDCGLIVKFAPKEFKQLDSWVVFRRDGMYFFVKKWEMHYVDLAELLNRDGVPIKLEVDIESAIERASVFVDDLVWGIRVKLGKDSMILESKGASGWYRESIPVRVDISDSIEFDIGAKLFHRLVKCKEVLVCDKVLRVSKDGFDYVVGIKRA